MTDTTSVAQRFTPQQMAALADLASKIAHDPAQREAFAVMAAKHAPNDVRAAFPDVVMRREMRAWQKKFEDDRLKEKGERLAEDKRKERDTVQQKFKYSDTQMADVGKLFDQFGDWEAASAVYAQRNPPENPALKPPPEVVTMGQHWDFPTVPDATGKQLEFKDYIKDPRKYSNNTAIQMITEFKRRQMSPAFHV